MAPTATEPEGEERLLKFTIGTDSRGFPTLMPGRGRGADAVWVEQEDYPKLKTQLNDLAKTYEALYLRHLALVRDKALELIDLHRHV